MKAYAGPGYPHFLDRSGSSPCREYDAPCRLPLQATGGVGVAISAFGLVQYIMKGTSSGAAVTGVSILVVPAVLAGGVIRLLSGLTGGGIFLSPLLLFTG
jgi:hypothetical protein